MSVGHTIGNRSHIIEKKRDKDGRVRQQQKFVNIDEDDAHDFNDEFKSRAAHNLGLRTENNSSRRAIESGRQNVNNSNNVSTNSGPIVTVPDDDEEDVQYVGRRG